MDKLSVSWSTYLGLFADPLTLRSYKAPTTGTDAESVPGGRGIAALEAVSPGPPALL